MTDFQIHVLQSLLNKIKVYEQEVSESFDKWVLFSLSEDIKTILDAEKSL